MTLQSGTKLGPYEILAPIGAGGMGEVYKARDTRLARTVAVKVLPSQFSENAEMKARFEREAKTIGGLHHPNICVLHDIGHQDGTDYLVMEFLEGQTLAQRLEKGALPLDEALKIGMEIADALDKAHRQGVVHRDLKPSNVMLTKSGTKLLDFGLAKTKEEGNPAVNLSAMPTNADVTAKGTILGTLQYMSPEQLEGEATGAPSDVFAFGVVLYEMMSGRKAFSGKTATSTMASILKEQPAPIRDALAGGLAAQVNALDHVISRCLAKNPEDRWKSMGDLRIELAWISETAQSFPPDSFAQRPPARSRLGWTAAVGIVVLAFLVFLSMRLLQPALPQPGISRLLMPIEPATSLLGNGAFWPVVAIDPSGTRVAFIALGGGSGRNELFVRSLDRFDATDLPGTAGAAGPAFSPDGQWIAFLADGSLKKVPAGGGPVQIICPATGLGVTWVSNDTIVFSSSSANVRLMRVSSQGGTPEPLVKSDNSELLRWAVAGPGSSVIFSARAEAGANWDDSNIDIVSLDGSSRGTLLHGGVPIRLLPGGILIFRRGSDVFAVSFDPNRRTVTGQPVPILDNVDYSTQNGASDIAISDDATIVYQRDLGNVNLSRSLLWTDPARTSKVLAVQSQLFEDPRVSPEGQRVAFEVTSDGDDIWVVDLRRDSKTRLTFDPGEDETPVWSPDGKWIAYSGSHNGSKDARNVFRKAADGSGTEEQLFASASHVHVDDWSHDNRELLLTIEGTTTLNDVWVLPLDGKGKAEPVLKSNFNEHNARLSPDGRWIAYVSNESRIDEVYVQPYPSLAGGKWQVSTNGGDQPVWSRNGRTLYYRGIKQVMAVDVTAGTTLQLSPARSVFEDIYETKGQTHTGYDIAPDGKFLFVRDNEAPTAEKNLAVIENFMPELRRRLGLKN